MQELRRALGRVEMMGIGGVGLPTDEEHLQGRVQNEDDGACLGDGDASPDWGI